MHTVYKPVDNISYRDNEAKSVFLAGSIDNGEAENWQTKSENFLKQYFTIFNPRRDDWDSSWDTTFENPQFFQQVMWELSAMEIADHILMYFAPNSKSPITLLELGMNANSDRLIVVCPSGFWRKGNVDMVCNYFDIPQFEDLDSAYRYLIDVAFN